MLSIFDRSADETDEDEAEEEIPATVTVAVSDAGRSLRHTIPKLAVEEIGFDDSHVDIDIYEDRYVVRPHQGE